MMASPEESFRQQQQTRSRPGRKKLHELAISVLLFLSALVFLRVAKTIYDASYDDGSIHRESSVVTDDVDAPSDYDPTDYGRKSKRKFNSPVSALLDKLGQRRGDGSSDPADEPSHLLWPEIPEPLQVMEQYVKWHSLEALQSEHHARTNSINQSRNRSQHFDDDFVGSERRFAIGFYSCPLQAGNRLHHFFNGLLWAIITNRTLLYKYWDTETCQKYDGRYYNPKICKSANVEEDCHALKRQAWIPSYDDWKDRLGLQGIDDSIDQGGPYELPYYTTHHPNVSESNRRFPWDGDKSVFGVDNVTKYPHRIVVFPQERFKDLTLIQDDVDGNGGVVALETLLHTEWSREAATKLYSYGPDFLYGMLHRYSFEFSDEIIENTRPLAGSHDNGDGQMQENFTHDPYTIALHSRHRFPELDGCDVAREQRCLRKMLGSIRPDGVVDDQTNQTQKQQQKRHCAVAIMSDRPCTIKLLTSWITKWGCQVHVASHDTGGSFFEEHGPFAGLGYFQDLALVSTATSAFVGMERSSSDLLLELIQYNRVMSTLQQGGMKLLSRLPELDICRLPFEGPGKQKSSQG